MGRRRGLSGAGRWVARLAGVPAVALALPLVIHFPVAVARVAVERSPPLALRSTRTPSLQRRAGVGTWSVGNFLPNPQRSSSPGLAFALCGGLLPRGTATETDLQHIGQLQPVEPQRRSTPPLPSASSDHKPAKYLENGGTLGPTQRAFFLRLGFWATFGEVNLGVQKNWHFVQKIEVDPKPNPKSRRIAWRPAEGRGRGPAWRENSQRGPAYPPQQVHLPLPFTPSWQRPWPPQMRSRGPPEGRGQRRTGHPGHALPGGGHAAEAMRSEQRLMGEILNTRS